MGGSDMARISNAVLLNEHPVDQALLRYFLSSRGIASSSLSPRARLETLEALSPDLVIADARGTHPCATLRRRLPDARIVAVAEEPGAVEGADAVLHRPLDFQRVSTELRAIVDGPAVKEEKQPRKCVLLVDDDTDVLSVARKVLETAGCAVTCVADPSEVLRGRKDERYDLVLLDVVMPEVDGLQLCYTLRQRYGEDLRICMLTGATDPESVKRAARYGADGWLTKPIRKEELLALVGLGERRLLEPAARPRLATAKVKVTKRAAVPKRPHVLVVDDDRDILEYCRAVLAEAGAVALAHLDSGAPCDLVVWDWRMPEMSGMQTLAEVRRRRSDLPFVFLTARAKKEEIDEGLRMGARRYLTKPFEPAELLG